MATQPGGGLDSGDWKCSNPKCTKRLPGRMIGMKFCPFCGCELRRAGPRTANDDTDPKAATQAIAEGKGTDGSRSSQISQASSSGPSDLAGETGGVPESPEGGQIASGDPMLPTVAAADETLQSLRGANPKTEKTADTNLPPPKTATETAADANVPSPQRATDTNGDIHLSPKTDTDAHVSNLLSATDITAPPHSPQRSSDTPLPETSGKLDEYETPMQETGDDSDKGEMYFDAEAETDSDKKEVQGAQSMTRAQLEDEARKYDDQEQVEKRRKELADRQKAQQVSQMTVTDDGPLQVKVQGAGEGDEEGEGNLRTGDVGGSGSERSDGDKSARRHKRGHDMDGAGGKKKSGGVSDNGGVVKHGDSGDSRDGGVVGTGSGGGDSAVAGGSDGSGDSSGDYAVSIIHTSLLFV